MGVSEPIGCLQKDATIERQNFESKLNNKCPSEVNKSPQKGDANQKVNKNELNGINAKKEEVGTLLKHVTEKVKELEVATKKVKELEEANFLENGLDDDDNVFTKNGNNETAKSDLKIPTSYQYIVKLEEINQKIKIMEQDVREKRDLSNKEKQAVRERQSQENNYMRECHNMEKRKIEEKYRKEMKELQQKHRIAIEESEEKHRDEVICLDVGFQDELEDQHNSISSMKFTANQLRRDLRLLGNVEGATEVGSDQKTMESMIHLECHVCHCQPLFLNDAFS